MVLDPGETQSNSGDNLDDIAEAAFDLQEVIDSTHHVISRKLTVSTSTVQKTKLKVSILVYDVDMEPLANLELEIEYSDALWGYFEELAANAE